jgi:hypothetical protein
MKNDASYAFLNAGDVGTSKRGWIAVAGLAGLAAAFVFSRGEPVPAPVTQKVCEDVAVPGGKTQHMCATLRLSAN